MIERFEAEVLRLKGIFIYSVIFSKATPLFYKGRSWPKTIFRDALKSA